MAQIRGKLIDDQEWHPLACVKRGDEYLLKVDTELSIDAATLVLDNIFVASTDGTVNGAKYIKVDANGQVYLAGSLNISYGTPKHYNGNANIAPATVTFAATTKHLQIENTDTGSKIIYISFDSGTNWRTIRAGETFDLDCEIGSIDIKASVDAVPYEIVTTE